MDKPMTYELAKQLKDAGFPQGKGDYLDGGEPSDSPHWLDKHTYVPTLSELIEACKKNGLYLHLTDNPAGWCAALAQLNGNIEYVIINIPTPEEAVAKLWLALTVPKSLENPYNTP